MPNQHDATTNDIMEFLKEHMVTKEDAKDFATKEDAKDFTTKEDMRKLEARFDKVDVRFDKVDARLESIDSRLVVLWNSKPNLRILKCS